MDTSKKQVKRLASPEALEARIAPQAIVVPEHPFVVPTREPLPSILPSSIIPTAGPGDFPVISGNDFC